MGAMAKIKMAGEFKIHLKNLTDREFEELWYELFKTFTKFKKNKIAKSIFIKKKKLIKMEYKERDIEFPEKPKKIPKRKDIPRKCAI